MFKGLKTRAVAVAVCGAMAFSAVTPAAAQMPNFGGMVGGAIGAAVGRGGKDMAGKLIAGAVVAVAASVILKGLIDNIEKNNAKAAANAAVKTGNPETKTFKNSKGQEVKVSTRVETSKNAEGRNCRQVTTTVERDGKSAAGGGTQTVCEVQLASGQTGYPTIE